MVSLEQDFKQIEKSLENVGLDRNVRRVQRTILRRLGQKGRSEGKKGYRSNLNKNTGDLYRSISYKVSKNNVVVISPRGGKNLMKANVLENGAIIKPKQGDYLTYMINGKWVKSKVSVIRPRKWFFSYVNNWFRGESEKVIEETLNKEIMKIWERGK